MALIGTLVVLLALPVAMAIQSSIVSCNGAGLTIELDDIDTTWYRGMPYVQYACMDMNCGQDGDLWLPHGSAIKKTYFISMDMMMAYPACGVIFQNATTFQYRTKIILPRLSDPIELASDYMLEAVCYMDAEVEMTPPVNDVLLQVDALDVPQQLIDGNVDLPQVEAEIVLKSSGQRPAFAVNLGERLMLRVDYTAESDDMWDQLRVLEFRAWNRNRTHHIHIVSQGCLTEEAVYINAAGAEDYEPVTEIEFDAMRFKEEDEVFFDLIVRVCRSASSSDACTYTCGLRRKRAADDTITEHLQMSTVLQTRVMVEDDAETVALEMDAKDFPLEQLRDLESQLLHPTEQTTQQMIIRHPPGLCLDMMQMITVCILLLVLLLIAACMTGYYVYRTFVRRRRHDSFGHLSVLARKGSLRDVCTCKQSLLHGRCQCAL